MTKLTIVIDYDLATIKKAYRNFFGAKGKVTKLDIAVWAGSLAQADIENYIGTMTEEQELEWLTKKDK